MKLFLTCILTIFSFIGYSQQMTVSYNDTIPSLVKASQSLLYAVRTDEDAASFISQLQNSSVQQLEMQLNTDEKRIAFWLNIYNAYTQLMLKKDPDQYKKRSRFFGAKEILIAGEKLSLDKIEHGILRRSKVKWSLGHLNKLFPDSFEKKFRVDRPDYRIHFALNCGAKSCPPIAYYDAEKIDQQLSMATKTYLKNEVVVDSANNIIRLPAIMGWFRKDFGGKKKMIELLKRLNIIEQNARPRIRFRSYDWSLYLANYKTDNNE